MSGSTNHFEVAVIGCGAVGSAALYQLTRRGMKALGIDRYSPPHDRGSSHGETRITRLALGEGEQYVQFVRRSHEIWRELERHTGRTLLQQVGGLIYGSTRSREETHGAADFLATTINVARKHGIRHEVLEADALRARFPQFRWQGDELGYFEPDAGFVHPEECIAAQLETAGRLGAKVHSEEQVLHWTPLERRTKITTTIADYTADHVIVTAGPWIPQLVPQLAPHARVFRQVLFWFEPDGPFELFTPERMPVYIRVPDAGTPMFYGFPAVRGAFGGMKIATEYFENTVSPDRKPQGVSEAEIASMHRVASPHVRISRSCVSATGCLYTVTPDFNFIVDRHPQNERIWIGSACSGHGFKHSAAVGEALAEMVTKGTTKFDLAPFGMQRLFGPD